jgi:hypothetical protein
MPSPRVLLGTALAAGAVLAAGPVATGSAVAPGTNGPIAFVTGTGSASEIWIVNPDGSGLTRLTSNAVADESPAWSPDGTRIAFVSARDGNEEIYVMNRDGTGIRRLTTRSQPDRAPAWSPNGQEIAFDSGPVGGPREVFTMNADGSLITNLQSLPTMRPYSVLEPTWSPDGTTIAAHTVGDGIDDVFEIVANPEQHRGDANRVTFTTDDLETGASWSPDGTRIAFAQTDREQFPAPSGNRILTAQSMFPGNAQPVLLGPGGAPAFSPDGTRMAFAADDGTIWTMTSDGAVRTPVPGARGRDPDWGNGPLIPPPPPPPPPVVVTAVPGLTIAAARFDGRFRVSRFTGALVLTVNAVRPARLRADFLDRRGRSRAHAFLVVPTAGSLTRRLRLPPAFGPGRYIVRVSERPPISAPEALPVATARAVLAAPPEGVVARAFLSRRFGGRAIARLRGPRLPVLLFANFRFAARPAPKQSLRVRWFWSGRKAAVLENARRLSGGAVVDTLNLTDVDRLPAGRYTAVLLAGKVVVARATARLG